MQPNFELRIRSMGKSLTDTVLPTISPDNKIALEQLHLVISSLSLLSQQVEYVHWYESIETSSMLKQAEELSKQIGHPADDLMGTANVAAIQATKPDAPLSLRQQGNILLREALVRLIERGLELATDDVSSTNLRKIVLRYSREQIGRERAFVAATNLDVFPDNLVSIEQSLVDHSLE